MEPQVPQTTTPETPKEVDVVELTERVLKIRRGELPPDAVTTEELRAAVSKQRTIFAEGVTKESAAKKPTKPKKQGAIDFSALEFNITSADNSSESGGLF